MPEVKIFETPFIKALKKVSPSSYGVLFNKDSVLYSLGEILHEKCLGAGSESCVFVDKVNPQKVKAVQYHSLKNLGSLIYLTPWEAKRIFYTQRIYSLLFPHNFPHFYATFGTLQSFARQHITGSIRKRVLSYSALNKHNQPPTKYPFNKVRDTCVKWDIPLQVDDMGDHFILTEEGAEAYCDVLKYHRGSVFSVLESINMARRNILAYMEHENYPSDELDKVIVYCNRLVCIAQNESI